MTTTVKITEIVIPNYRAMIDCSTTHAVILNMVGMEIDNFGGPVSQQWLPNEWDTALVETGWRRVSDWNVSDGTAQVERMERER